MSDFWSFWVIAIVTINLVGCAWLLLWTSKPIPGEPSSGETMGHTFDGIEEYNNPMPRWWLYLFWGTLAFAAAYLSLYPGYGKFSGMLKWTSHQQWEDEVKATEARIAPVFQKFASVPVEELWKDKEAHDMGKRLFLQNCSVCHGSSAHGAKGFPNLTDSDWLYGGEGTTIVETVTNGRQAMMPAWGQILGENGVNEVAHYVKSLSDPSIRAEKPELVAAGEKRFQQNCVACHGADAKGTHAMGAPNLTDKIWLYGGDIATIKETITGGRQGQMPAQKDRLSPEKIHLLAAYVYGLSQAK